MIKVLFVSRYVDPYSAGANTNVFKQAKYINDYISDIHLDILTWPKTDLWTGPVPPVANRPNILTLDREGVTYHVFNAPHRLDVPAGGAELLEDDWQKAIQYGMQILSKLMPDIVHLQHRHGLWWILESAQRLGIETIYTNHDWGIPCMRTVLVTGNNKLCDGVVEPTKCTSCIRIGRTSLFGRINERLVNNNVGELLARLVDRISIISQTLRNRGFVIQKAETRTLLRYQRAKRVIERLSHCFTPSSFGASFFSQFGCPRDRITVLPWYHDSLDQRKTLKQDQPFTITYVGRVSPEKGIDLIFAALRSLDDCEPVLLRIAGANDSDYCIGLMEQYRSSIGIHTVEWLGWTKVGPLFQNTDVAIIPSQWVDNTPLSLVEALAYRTPVIATRVRPIEELLVEGETGFLADFGSVDSLADAIRRALLHKSVIRSQSIAFPKMYQLHEYMAKVVDVYRQIVRGRSINEH